MLGAIIGGAASLATGIGKAISSRRQAKKKHKRDFRLWKKQQEYNHPVKQMQRLREANLNPNLIYGTSPTSAVGNASPAPPSAMAEPLDMDLTPLKDMMQYADITKKNQETNNLMKQNELIEQDIYLRAQEVANANLDHKMDTFTHELNEELRQTSIDGALSKLRTQEAVEKKARIQADFANEKEAAAVEKMQTEVKIAAETLSIKELEAWVAREKKRFLEEGLDPDSPAWLNNIAIILRDPEKRKAIMQQLFPTLTPRGFSW